MPCRAASCDAVGVSEAQPFEVAVDEVQTSGSHRRLGVAVVIAAAVALVGALHEGIDEGVRDVMEHRPDDLFQNDVCELVVQRELGTVVSGDRADRVRWQRAEEGELGVHCGFGRDGGDLHCLVVAAGAFHGGVDAAGAVGSDHTVGFPVPELFPILDLRRSVVDRGAPSEAFPVHVAALLPAPLLLTPWQVLPEFAVLLARIVDPRVERLDADPHPFIGGELDREPAGDLRHRPTLTQMSDHPVDEPVVPHPEPLMRPLLALVGLQLRLPSQIQTLMPATRVQLVPQIRAQVRVIMLGLPRTPPDLPRDRGRVHPDPTRDLRLADVLLQKLLDLHPVSQAQMSVMCGQGSATLRSSA